MTANVSSALSTTARRLRLGNGRTDCISRRPLPARAGAGLCRQARGTAGRTAQHSKNGASMQVVVRALAQQPAPPARPPRWGLNCGCVSLIRSACTCASALRSSSQRRATPPGARRAARGGLRRRRAPAGSPHERALLCRWRTHTRHATVCHVDTENLQTKIGKFPIARWAGIVGRQRDRRELAWPMQLSRATVALRRVANAL